MESRTTENSPRVSQDYRYLQLNASFLPELDENQQIVSLGYSTNNQRTESFNRVTLPYGVKFDLASTAVPQATRLAYENRLIRKILSIKIILHSSYFKIFCI